MRWKDLHETRMVPRLGLRCWTEWKGERELSATIHLSMSCVWNVSSCHPVFPMMSWTFTLWATVNSSWSCSCWYFVTGMRKVSKTSSTQSGPISLLDFPCRSAPIACLCDFALKFVWNSILQSLGNLMTFAHRCNFQHCLQDFVYPICLDLWGSVFICLKNSCFVCLIT